MVLEDITSGAIPLSRPKASSTIPKGGSVTQFSMNTNNAVHKETGRDLANVVYTGHSVAAI